MPNVPTRHADHDPLLVAAYAAGDATGTELDAAQALVAGCPDCAALHHDLRSIAAALPTLPVPVRRRDFRLAPEQAAALRPPGWRRLLDVFAGPRFRFAGPLGTGLATLGLAGLLVAGGAGVPLGGGTTSSVAGAPSDGASQAEAPAAAPVAGAAASPYDVEPSGAPSRDDTSVKANDAAASPGSPVQPFASRLAASASVAPEAFTGDGASPVPAAGSLVGAPATPDGPGQGPPLLPVVSALALVLGLVLAALRLAGRRTGVRA